MARDVLERERAKLLARGEGGRVRRDSPLLEPRPRAVTRFRYPSSPIRFLLLLDPRMIVG